jgi:hypothetical protein
VVLDHKVLRERLDHKDHKVTLVHRVLKVEQDQEVTKVVLDHKVHREQLDLQDHKVTLVHRVLKVEEDHKDQEVTQERQVLQVDQARKDLQEL